jgi:hypothetical protein
MSFRTFQKTHGISITKKNDAYGTVFAGFVVLPAVVMKSSISRDIMPCNPLKVYRRFGRTCRLHLQSQRISQALLTICVTLVTR